MSTNPMVLLLQMKLHRQNFRLLITCISFKTKFDFVFWPKTGHPLQSGHLNFVDPFRQTLKLIPAICLCLFASDDNNELGLELEITKITRKQRDPAGLLITISALLQNSVVSYLLNNYTGLYRTISRMSKSTNKLGLQHTIALKQQCPRDIAPLLTHLGGGGWVRNKCLYGEVSPRGPTPYPFIYHFSRKRFPFPRPVY